VRLLFGALLLGALFLAATLWQRHWTSAARAEREARISRIGPESGRESDRTARAGFGEGWSRVVIGRPGASEAYLAPVRAEDLEPARAEPVPGAVPVTPQSQPTNALKHEVVRIQSGQNLSTICRDRYGSARLELVEAVARFNRLASPDHVRAGAELELPALEVLLPRR